MSVTQNPRVLIIGGLGYFGSRLASALCDNFEVTVTSRSLSDTRKDWLVQQKGKVKNIYFDSAEQVQLPEPVPFDFLINLSTANSTEAAQNFEGCVSASLKTLEACTNLLSRGTAKRLIHFSSFHVYGSPGAEANHEDSERIPLHPYGKVHFEAEKWLEKNAATLPITVLRPTNGVGAPAHNDLGVQSKLLFLDCCRQAVEEGQIRLKSDGSAYRDFVPLIDFINAIRTILVSPIVPLSFYNLASGKVSTLRELALAIQDKATEFLNRPITLTMGTLKDPLNRPFTIQIDKLMNLGWSPGNYLNREIHQTLAFYKVIKNTSLPQEALAIGADRAIPFRPNV